MAATGTATVKAVPSGDTLVLVGRPAGGPPPEIQISLAGLSAPKVCLSLSIQQPQMRMLQRMYTIFNWCMYLSVLMLALHVLEALAARLTAAPVLW
jgi:hypothetical protein